MTPLKSFDKSNIKVVVRPEVTRLLNELKQYGINASVGTIRFSTTSLRFKVEMQLSTPVTTPNGVVTIEPVEVTELKRFEKNNPSFGSLVGRGITVSGKSFVINGYKPSRHQYPFSVTGVAGGKYKLSENNVRQALGLPIAPLGRPFGRF